MKISRGWNTWFSRSATAHVFLEEAVGFKLGLKDAKCGGVINEMLFGERDTARLGNIVPGKRSYDAGYTSLEVDYKDNRIRIETCVHGDDWYALATPLTTDVKQPWLIVEAAAFWNKPASFSRDEDSLTVAGANRSFTLFSDAPVSDELAEKITAPYLTFYCDRPVGLTTAVQHRADIARVVHEARETYERSRERFGEDRELMDSISACLAWNTIFDPQNERTITPVSRRWCEWWGGWVLFCWDTYFAATLASIENKELAYANAIAITDDATEGGFIPNGSGANGYKSRDRSQPPVGSMTVRQLCDTFGETRLAERLFDPLLKWNRWWPEKRDVDGYLCWGSNRYERVTNNIWETKGVNQLFGGALESGLDNSPMYDDMVFDEETGIMQLADVGLMSLYILDCKELAAIARMIGRTGEQKELLARADRYGAKLKELWSEEEGIFLNYDLARKEFSRRLSPTHFYPLLTGIPTQVQAERMINEHFFNPDEFGGDWILPSIARNDPAYPSQDYWRGRIWAPMNYLVYLGLLNYDLPEARKELAEKSKALFLREYRANGHIYESYNAIEGVGADGKMACDAFYHWGALLALIALMEKRHEKYPKSIS